MSKVLSLSSIGEKGDANVEPSEGLARPASSSKPCEPGFLQSFPSAALPGTRLLGLRGAAVVAPLVGRR